MGAKNTKMSLSFYNSLSKTNKLDWRPVQVTFTRMGVNRLIQPAVAETLKKKKKSRFSFITELSGGRERPRNGPLPGSESTK